MANFDYYKIFFYAATANSFSRAAQILDTTQPNVTRCMNNLEAQLGTRLFARSRNGISLTPEGKQLYDDIQQAIPLLESAEAQFLHHNPIDKGLITIGVTDIAMHLLILPIMKAFHNKQPNVRFKIISSSSYGAVQAVESAKVDFSILTTPVRITDPIKAEKVLSFQESFYTSYSQSSLLNGATLSQISTRPFICTGMESSTRQFCQTLFQKEKVDLRIDFEANSMEQVLHLIQYGIGIGLYPDTLAQASQSEHPIFQIPTSFSIPKREILIVYDSRKSQSVASQLFIDEIRSYNASTE